MHTFFIDNSNIEIRDLWKDGIHLLESDKTKLAMNFIYFLNNSYRLTPHDYFSEAHIHGNIEHTHSQLLNTKNCESILDKSILNTSFNFSFEMVQDKADLLIILETKLNFSFPNAQFYMKSYSKPYRLDRNSKGEGIILYVMEDIPSKLVISSCTDHDKEYYLVE